MPKKAWLKAVGICEDEILSVHECTIILLINSALLMHALMFILTLKLFAIGQSGVKILGNVQE